jgi:5-methylcytosine-specific restriction endonuclease McrA
MKFVLKKYNINIPDDDLLTDIKKCADKNHKNRITIEEYDEYGLYSAATIRKRFGNWHQALKKAGLDYKSETHEVTKEELFQNLKNVWECFGRQPTYNEIKKPLSKFSTRPYVRMFESWQNALETFVLWVNDDNQEHPSVDSKKSQVSDISLLHSRKRTTRDISDRLRFAILLRDGFGCQSCGASPLKNPGIELHVDHIIPWSKGGETVRENLQTKCKRCNLGKGNAFDK